MEINRLIILMCLINVDTEKLVIIHYTVCVNLTGTFKGLAIKGKGNLSRNGDNQICYS